MLHTMGLRELLLQRLGLKQSLRVSIVLLTALYLSGCGTSKAMIEGDRITILDNTDGQDASGFAPYIDLPMPFENLQWTQFNGSSRRTMTHVAVNPDVKEVWKKKIGAPSDGALGHLGAPPVIVGEYVYTMDARSKISAYNSLTGATYWEYVNDSDGDKGGFGGGLAASGTHLFVTLGLGEVLCLDTETGILLWKKELSAPVRAAPALYGDVVIVVSRDDKAFGLDAETGAIKWSFQGVRGELSSIGAAVPAADRGIAVIPFSSGEIVAVRVSTGERIWTRVIDSGSATSLLSVFTEIAGGPVIYSDRVIASSYSGALVSLDLNTGMVQWKRNMGSYNPVWVTRETLFFISDDAKVISLRVKDGKTIWRTQLPQFAKPKKRMDAIVYSGPVLASNRVYVVSSEGKILQFDAKTGAMLSSFDFGKTIMVGPVFANKALYILDKNNMLYKME